MFHFRKLIIALLPVVLIVAIYQDIILPCEGDRGWLLHAAHKWLAGNTLYVKIFEVNPPLIIWIYALAVLIASHVSWIRDYQALACIGLIGSFFSVWVGMRLIALHPAFAGDRQKQTIFAVLLTLIFIFYTTEPYFFDREHILIVFGFPYMLRFMPQLKEQQVPRWLRFIIGCMAAIAFCIKPHGMLIFLSVQLFTLWRTRSLRSLLVLENFIIAGLTAMYLLIILLLTPEYFTVVLPMAYRTYGFFRNDSTNYAYLPPIFVGAGLIFADFRPRYTTPYRPDVYYLAWLCLSFLVYAELNNGWGYTFSPLYCMLTFIAGWMLWDYDWLRRAQKQSGSVPRHILFGMRGCFIVLITHAAYMVFYMTVMGVNANKLIATCSEDPDCLQNAPFEQYFADHRVHSFGTLSFDFSRWVTLMRRSETDWDTRFNHLWMLPKLILKDEYMQRYYSIVEYVAKGLAEDLNINRPDVVFVDGSPGLMQGARTFDLPRLLSGVPEFKEAWSHYRYATNFSGCPPHSAEASACRYDLYTRIP